MELLSPITIQELVNNKPLSVVTISEDLTIRSAMEILSKFQINGAPVVNSEGRVQGVVDTLDLTRVLSVSVAECMDSLERLEVLDKHLDNPISSIVNHAEGDALVFVNSSQTACSILKFLSGGFAHRCIVEKGNNPLYSICSQSDVIEYIYEHVRHLDQVPASFSDPILNILPQREPVTCHKDDCMFEIVKKLSKKGVGCIGLVDDKGQLAGNLSSSDLVHLNRLDGSFLLSPASEYLTNTSPFSLSPVVVPPNCSTISILEKMCIHKFHRIWAVDCYNKPLRVITMTDLLHLFHSKQLTL